MLIPNQAYDVAPGDEVFARTTVVTAERIALPASMRNKYCTFIAETVDVWIRFGDGTVVVDEAATSGLTNEVPSEDGGEPHLYIPAGTQQSIRLDFEAGWTHFSHISTATSGLLRFGSSTGVGNIQ
jgi:hypothetical protein